jgi:hypothetical protein
MARFSVDGSLMRTRIDCPEQRAAMYLKRIVALTGARRVCGDTYFLKAAGKRFLIDNGAVRLISHSGGKSTCFSIPTRPYMPREEVIASGLLQLKSNPKLFKKWRKQPGYLFRADGKKFCRIDGNGKNTCRRRNQIRHG